MAAGDFELGKRVVGWGELGGEAQVHVRRCESQLLQLASRQRARVAFARPAFFAVLAVLALLSFVMCKLSHGGVPVFFVAVQDADPYFFFVLGFAVSHGRWRGYGGRVGLMVDYGHDHYPRSARQAGGGAGMTT